MLQRERAGKNRPILEKHRTGNGGRDGGRKRVWEQVRKKGRERMRRKRVVDKVSRLGDKCRLQGREADRHVMITDTQPAPRVAKQR